MNFYRAAESTLEVDLRLWGGQKKVNDIFHIGILQCRVVSGPQYTYIVEG